MNGFEAYVDGSFSPDKKLGGAAWVILQGEVVLYQGQATLRDGLESRNVTGELVAVLRVLDLCEQQSIQEITVFHDLEGTGFWARGEWKCKIPLIQQFHARVQSSAVRMSFVWVKGHAGNPWNELVDRFARTALHECKRVVCQDRPT